MIKPFVWVPIARFEWKHAVRQWWMVTFTLVFLLFQTMFLISEWSASASPGFSGFHRMTGQLLNMNLLMLPIMAMLMGSLSVAGDKEDQQWDLLSTYPLPRFLLILGKFTGLLTAFTAMITLSYGILGIAGYFLLPSASIQPLIVFLMNSIALIIVFLSIGILMGKLAKSRLQAIALSVVIWFFSLFVIPFLTLNLALFMPAMWVKSWIGLSTLINPAEFMRVSSIFLLGNGEILGAPFYQWNEWFTSAAGYVAVWGYSLGYAGLILFLSSLRRKGRS